MATTKIINDLIDLNQTGNTTALKGCVGTNAQQPATPTISVEYLVLGGGGGANGSGSGGGGAGGLSTGTIAVPNNTAVNIVIGQGGLGVLNNASDGLPAGQGQDSGFYTIQGQGGGAGVHRGNGFPGGSGAGAGVAATTVYSGGSGVSGQGNAGGSSSATWSAGGGGGAGAVGTNGISSQAGAGGVGSTTTIISTTNATTASVGEQNGGNLYFAGGGGGGGSDSAAGGNTLGGSGGLGGGGDGTGQCSNCPGGSATLNTGGGGGGSAAATVDTAGGSGGSGVVILRFASSTTYSVTGITVGNAFTEGSGATEKTVLVFKTGTGTINLTDTSLPGPKVGDLRTNTDQTSASSASAMEHYMSTGWRVFDNFTTVSTCNYPITAAALYQFEDTPNATCGPNPTTTANLTYVAGKFGKAVDFNGTDSVWQSTNQIINSRSSFSISMWVKIDAYSSPDTGYLWTGYATGDWSINIGGTGSKYFRFAKYDNTQSPIYIEIADPSVAALGQWYHVCGTFSTTTGMVLYVDGTSVGSDNTTWAGQNHGAYSDSIGCYGYTPSGNRADFDGQIDQFRAFQSALTSTQVEELYNES